MSVNEQYYKDKPFGSNCFSREARSQGGGGGGGTLIFSHIHRLGLFFWVQNFEFNIFGGFQKNEYFFGGIKILWIHFWGHYKIGLV